MVNLLKSQGDKFDFNDILIVPSTTTNIKSRYGDVFLSEELPLMTAPMDTVVNHKNASQFSNRGISVILPRTEIRDWNEYEKKISWINDNGYFVSLSMDMFEELNTLKDVQLPKKVLLDIANGHIFNKIIWKCKLIKHLDPTIEIMVGSIANPETYRTYAESGVVDYVRCGIGGGNGCLTTKNSGVGYPMGSLIYECRRIKEELKGKTFESRLPKIVADGGMKDYSDIIKALGLGADYVLLGSILNKALESAGDNYFLGIKISPKLAKFLFKRKFNVKKYFRGMSTKQAQKAMGKTKLKTSEGVIRYRPIEYTLNGWVENFEHYLRNAMSYTDNNKIHDFIGNINFCKITHFAYKRFDK